MTSLQTTLTQQVERIIEQNFRIEECTILEFDRRGELGVQAHSPDNLRYQNTVTIKPRSTKPGSDFTKIELRHCTILQNFVGNRFGHPYTPRAGDIVLVLWLMHFKPIILGPVISDSQQPLIRGPTSKDAMYDFVWKWCQWLRPKQNPRTGDYYDHPPGQDAQCFKLFHGPVTGMPGKGRDVQMVWDCQKGNIDPGCKGSCLGCPKCETIDSVERDGEQWIKEYSTETESEEAYNSRLEVHARSGSYVRFESDDHNDAGALSKEYTEGIGHIRIGNAVTELLKRAHINFHPTGTLDMHSEHEEVDIGEESKGARVMVTGANMEISDEYGIIAQEDAYLPLKAVTRIYRDGAIRGRANDGTDNCSEWFIGPDGHCWLWNKKADTYIEFFADGTAKIKATELTVQGNLHVTGNEIVDGTCSGPNNIQ